MARKADDQGQLFTHWENFNEMSLLAAIPGREWRSLLQYSTVRMDDHLTGRVITYLVKCWALRRVAMLVRTWVPGHVGNFHLIKQKHPLSNNAWLIGVNKVELTAFNMDLEGRCSKWKMKTIWMGVYSLRAWWLGSTPGKIQRRIFVCLYVLYVHTRTCIGNAQVH